MRYPVAYSIAIVLTLAACHDSPSEPPPLSPQQAQISSEARMQPLGTKPYIVKLTKSAGAQATIRSELLRSSGGVLKRTFTTALDGRGFVAWLTPEAAEALRRRPNVEHVHESLPAEITASRDLCCYGLGMHSLDRVYQREGPFENLDGYYNYFQTGSGVHLYFIDTGIDSTHTEFAGRWGSGWSAGGWVDTLGYHACLPGVDGGKAQPQYYQYHGTRAASLAAGTTYGVASGATVHSLRASCPVGFADDLIAALEWVQNYGTHPGVVNFNWDSADPDVKAELEDAYDAGWLVINGAGNDSVLAANKVDNTAYGQLVEVPSMRTTSKPISELRLDGGHNGTRGWHARGGP